MHAPGSNRTVATCVAVAALLSAYNLIGGSQSSPSEKAGPRRNSLTAAELGETDEPAERNSVADASGTEAADDTASESRPRAEVSAPEPEPPSEPARSGEEMLVGRWGEPDCAEVIDLRPEGVLAINGARGYWMLEGNTLTLTIGSEQQLYTLSQGAAGLMRVADEDGEVSTYVRC